MALKTWNIFLWPKVISDRKECTWSLLLKCTSACSDHFYIKCSLSIADLGVKRAHSWGFRTHWLFPFRYELIFFIFFCFSFFFFSSYHNSRFRIRMHSCWMSDFYRALCNMHFKSNRNCYYLHSFVNSCMEIVTTQLHVEFSHQMAVM